MPITASRTAFTNFVKALPKTQQNVLAMSAVPRIVEPYVKHIPHPKQQLFMNLKAQEAMFGGAAGGGKSDALLMAALQYVDVPGYSALILRRTWADLILPGAIMDRAEQWLSGTPARKREGGRLWEFPSGARLQFGYIQYDRDKLRYQSAEFQFIAFDELTQWSMESTYDYMFSRLRRPKLNCTLCNQSVRRIITKNRGRSTANAARYVHSPAQMLKTGCRVPKPDRKVLLQYPPSKDGTSIFDVPLRMRSATNPGGPGMEWVRGRFVNEKTRRPDTLFIRSRLQDNPSLDQKEYTAALSRLNPVDRERLLNGDWDVVEAGDLFDRADFEGVLHTPRETEYWVRFWDMAATSGGGDYTVGALCCVTKDKRFHIEHILRFQGDPYEVERQIKSTARVDGLGVAIRMEQEPGSAGKTVIANYKRNVLMGYNFDGIGSSGDKVTRASSLSSFVKGRNVTMKLAPWNRDFLDEMQLFPRGAFDDQVDAVASAYNFLALGPKVRIIV